MIKNKSLILFYVMFIFTLGVNIYLSGMYKMEKIGTIYSKIKKINDNHRYVFHMTEDYKIKLSRITYESGEPILEK